MSPEASSEGYPRVIRRGSQTCVQSLDALGHEVESCRETDDRRSRRQRSRRAAGAEEAPEEEVRGGFVFDLTARGGLMLGLTSGTSVALPAFSATLGLGGVSAGGVGAMGLLNVDIGSTRGFTAIAATLAPALRLGRTSHVSLALGPSVLAFDSVLGGGSGVILSALVQGVIQLGSIFSLALNGSAHFDASGAIFFLGVGFGVSTPH